jgi:hypothetical protein
MIDAKTTYINDTDIKEMWPELKIDPTMHYAKDCRVVGGYMQCGKLVPCARCYAFGFPCFNFSDCRCENKNSKRNPCKHANTLFHESFGIASFNQVRPYSWFPETYAKFLEECKTPEHQYAFDLLRYKN